MNVLTAAKLARPLLFLEQTPEGTGVMLRSSSLPLGAGQEAISTKEALYGYTPHRTLAQSLSGWSGGGRGTAGRDGFCHGLDGPASVLRQLPHHAGGRRDAQAVHACQACLQRMPRPAQPAGQAAVQGTGRAARLHGQRVRQGHPPPAQRAHPRRGQRKLQGLPLCHQQRSGQHGCQALLRGLPPQYGPHAPQAHQHKDGCL